MKDVIIKPKTAFKLIDFSDLWNYRNLFYVFAWRDIKVRYKQTVLGALWAIIQPLFSMFVFTIFFGNINKSSSSDIPYPLFVLVGLVFWNYFSGVLSRSSNSLIENQSIVKKIYFPRIMLPLSTIGANFIDFCISFSLMLLIVVFYGFKPSLLSIVIVPMGLFIGTIGASGLGLILASLNVKYRDIRYILPFFIQTLVFLSPVIYPVQTTNSLYASILAINPMTAVINSERGVLFGVGVLDWQGIALSIIVSLTLFILGTYYFNNTESLLADIL